MSTEHSTTTITGGHANAVAAGAAGFMSGADKTKLDGITAGAAATAFYGIWGCIAAPGGTASKFLQRTSGTVSATAANGDYPAPATGTFTFLLTWRVSSTGLSTDTVTLAVMVNGVATALTAVIAAGAPPSSGQASASLTVAAGDGVCIRLVQSSTEAQAGWNLSVSLRAQ